MRKKILSNTILFGTILLFVKVFERIFGSNNNLVAVTVIISILVLMQEDLTKDFAKNLTRLFLINIILGVFSYLAILNIWTGFIVNFIALSGIGYFLSANMNKVIIVPFGLQYLFMLYTPVTGIDYTKRLLCLGVGSVLIMAVQFLIHRKNDRAKVEKRERNQYDTFEYIQLFEKYKINKVRAAYAFRIGLLTAIAAFIVSYFELQQGRWIVYTIFSLIELYSENCKIRSKQRLQGTIIGAIIILILFMFIKDNTIRGLIVLVGGYLDSYTTNYRDKMICVTMSVVATVSLVNGTLITALERVFYVLLGIILAVIADKLIFNKKLADFEASLINEGEL
ncbi:FUSC family protein [Clostridium sp. Marseille-P299]|uniref:FUSC family protein n=1 Tax=Clostridium sp. Marseille-P299 TaxID=1805477 RepID=UPI00082AB8A1|nr:FUSC family protein [Clostridium sp. Marseille-P299]